MDSEIISKYKKAGRIAAEVLDYGKNLIKKDALLLDVTEKIEKKIFDLDAKPAFPAQISMNETAAHFYPEADDKIVFSEQLCSLDVGVHVDGYIGDCACTVDLSGEHKELVKASEDALNEAIKIIKQGVTLGEIGRIIEETIKKYGFNPVKNLSGHGLAQYNIHDAPTIPNFDTKDKTKLNDCVIAIEPFATTGLGMIHEKGAANVFSVAQKKSVRIGFVRDILKQIEQYNGLPFTRRWLLEKKFSKNQIEFAFNQFRQLDILHEYPPLVERTNGLVSQAEHSVLIDEDVVVLTRI